MTFPRLSQRIAQAELDPDVARTFAGALRQMVAHDPSAEPTKLALIRRLMAGDGGHEDASLDEAPEQPRAPFEALWPHAELLITACMYVALSDGQYAVQEARHVSRLAHKLGLSARQLEQLEARVFEELKLRGARKLAPTLAPQDDATEPGGPARQVRAAQLADSEE